jgi:N-acetyl-gamma-glutamyl-phosphate reductase
MTNKKIRAGIIGGAGYTGGELIRLLLNHPSVDISFIHSRSNAGKVLSYIHQDLVGETDLVFTGELNGLTDGNTDVLFLCAGHGEAMKFLVENKIHPATKIIDLSQDFRLKKGSVFNERNFVYGLPELNRELIKSANNIANPTASSRQRENAFRSIYNRDHRIYRCGTVAFSYIAFQLAGQ